MFYMKNNHNSVKTLYLSSHSSCRNLFYQDRPYLVDCHFRINIHIENDKHFMLFLHFLLPHVYIIFKAEYVTFHSIFINWISKLLRRLPQGSQAYCLFHQVIQILWTSIAMVNTQGWLLWRGHFSHSHQYWFAT